MGGHAAARATDPRPPRVPPRLRVRVRVSLVLHGYSPLTLTLTLPLNLTLALTLALTQPLTLTQTLTQTLALTRYRPVSSRLDVPGALLTLHNETANTWSHLAALGWMVHRS